MNITEFEDENNERLARDTTEEQAYHLSQFFTEEEINYYEMGDI